MSGVKHKGTGLVASKNPVEIARTFWWTNSNEGINFQAKLPIVTHLSAAKNYASNMMLDRNLLRNKSSRLFMRKNDDRTNLHFEI